MMRDNWLWSSKGTILISIKPVLEITHKGNFLGVRPQKLRYTTFVLSDGRVANLQGWGPGNP